MASVAALAVIPSFFFCYFKFLSGGKEGWGKVFGMKRY